MFEKNNFELLIKFGSYKPRFVIGRILLISVVSILLVYISGWIVGETPTIVERRVYAFVITVLGFNSISEINIFIMHLMGRSEKLRWNIYLQTTILVFVSLLITLFWLVISQRLFPEDNVLDQEITQIILTMGILILIIHLLVSIMSRLANEWTASREELESMKQAKLLSDYNSLKDRLNPHFLFNNLSVLKSLIHYDPQSAETFTQNFTDVYRYVLKSHEKSTTSLHKEMDFLDSYISLHKERIGEGLKVTLDIKEDAMEKEIPPLSLQLLVENAIKHNIANKNSPLEIAIYTEKDKIIVRNTLNKKLTTYSTQTGLNTLRAQYKLIANKEIEVLDDGQYYSVSLPLL